MRPQSLTPLFAQTTSLPGIGPRLGKLVEKLAGPLVVDLLWHLPFAVVDRRNAPEVVARQGGRDRHHDRDGRRAPGAAQSAPALSRVVQRRDRPALPHLLQRPRGLPEEAPAAGRGARGERQGRDLPGRGADDAPRPCRAARPARADPARRAGLRPDRRPDAAAGAEGHRRRRRALARAAGMAGRGLPQAQQVGRLARRPRARPCAGRGDRPLADASGARAPRLRRASGQPARHRPGAPSQPHRRGPRHQGRRQAARQGAEKPALRTDAEPEDRGRRDRGRHGQARAHDPPAAGRCRQRQDAGRPARHADLRRGRRPGRADGADRDPGAPAPRHHRAARRSRRRAARAADGPRRPEAEEGNAAGPGRRLDPSRRRHARAGAGGRRVRRPRAGRGRRAAPLRRAPAHGAVVQGPCRRPAGDDGDAHPAHPDAGGLRRSRRLQAHREAGRPPADRHPHPPARAHRRGGRRRRPPDRDAAGASTGCAR